MNEAQEQILAWCYQQNLRVPHVTYCTGSHRFGPTCRDCSGMTHEAYKSAGITIGTDTGSVARDVYGGRAGFRALTGADPADLVMRRSGSVYNGGSDEHIGIFVRLDGAYVWTWESAGSKNGHGLYRRLRSFWRDAVHYPALGKATPITPPSEDDMTADEAARLKRVEDIVGWLIQIELPLGYDKRGQPGNVPRTQAMLDLLQKINAKVG